MRGPWTSLYPLHPSLFSCKRSCNWATRAWGNCSSAQSSRHRGRSGVSGHGTRSGSGSQHTQW
eukprot:1161119-Pelagomonas_calceolata.AAC.4